MDRFTVFILIISAFITGLLTISIINSLILIWGWETTLIPILLFSYLLGETIAFFANIISDDLDDLHERED